jgi:hypothetical protein
LHPAGARCYCSALRESRVTRDCSLRRSLMEPAPALTHWLLRAPSPVTILYDRGLLTAAFSCIYVDFSLLLQSLTGSSSSSRSFPLLILSSLLSLPSLLPPSTAPPPSVLLSCHIALTHTLCFSALPLPPLLKNLTWGQAAAGGGDAQRRRTAAAALACTHAVEALAWGGDSAVLGELLHLLQVGLSDAVLSGNGRVVSLTLSATGCGRRRWCRPLPKGDAVSSQRRRQQFRYISAFKAGRSCRSRAAP